MYVVSNEDDVQPGEGYPGPVQIMERPGGYDVELVDVVEHLWHVSEGAMDDSVEAMVTKTTTKSLHMSFKEKMGFV